MHADRLCSKGGKEGDGRDVSKWVNGSVARKASLISGVEPCAMAFRGAPRIMLDKFFLVQGKLCILRGILREID